MTLILFIPNPVISVDPVPQSDYFPYAIIGGITVAVIVGVVAIIRIKQKIVKPIHNQQTIQKTESIDTEAIFKMKPDLREDDKEIVRFISNNGGQVLESDLRKKFLQPRTTMWRAVKRLERNGIIEIEKKDLQNLVKIRTDIEEEK
jgi:uncharacterized membrane protein